MYLLIAIGIAIIYIILHPLSDGLIDTSMWVSKILAPSETEDNDYGKHFLKMGQAALMKGWLSNIPFFTNILFCLCIVVGFLYSWWGGILMLFILLIFGSLANLFMIRSVSYYLVFISHKMVNRAVYYKRKNDIERYNASESYCKDLQIIINIYQDSQIKPPNSKQLKKNPFGDIHYWLNENNHLKATFNNARHRKD